MGFSAEMLKIKKVLAIGNKEIILEVELKSKIRKIDAP